MRRRIAALPSQAEASQLGAKVREAIPPSQALGSRVAELTERARRHNTVIAYESDWDLFEAWCDEVRLAPYATTDDERIEYLCSLWDNGLKYTTIARRAAGIAYHFRARGLPSPCVCLKYKQFKANLGRLEQRPVRRATALYGNTLTRLLDSLDRTELRDARDAAMFLFAASRGFRESEVACQRIEFFRFERRGVVIAVFDSKTNKTGEPEYRAIRHNPGKDKSHSYCAPCALRDYLALLGEQSGPAFRAIDRWGRLSNDALRPASITYILRQRLRAIVASPDGYAGHSFRHGAVAARAEAGWSITDIMLDTGHRSMRSFMAYLASVDPFYSLPAAELHAC